MGIVVMTRSVRRVVVIIGVAVLVLGAGGIRVRYSRGVGVPVVGIQIRQMEIRLHHGAQ